MPVENAKKGTGKTDLASDGKEYHVKRGRLAGQTALVIAKIVEMILITLAFVDILRMEGICQVDEVPTADIPPMINQIEEPEFEKDKQKHIGYMRLSTAATFSSRIRRTRKELLEYEQFSSVETGLLLAGIHQYHKNTSRLKVSQSIGAVKRRV